MTTILVGLAGVLFGLYAGRRRAGGESWSQIIVDFAHDSWKVARCICNTVTGLFKGNKPSSNAIVAAD